MKDINKAATEEEVGVLHGLITTLHKLKATALIDEVRMLLENGCMAQEIIALIESKDLMAMQKWVEYNKISCILPADDDDSELSKSLKALKESQAGKVIQFTQEETGA